MGTRRVRKDTDLPASPKLLQQLGLRTPDLADLRADRQLAIAVRKRILRKLRDDLDWWYERAKHWAEHASKDDGPAVDMTKFMLSRAAGEVRDWSSPSEGAPTPVRSISIHLHGVNRGAPPAPRDVTREASVESPQGRSDETSAA